MRYRTALITGATSGIGEAFARVLPAETDLLLTGRSEKRLQALVGELSDGDRVVEARAADLTVEADRKTLLDFAKARPIDLLINNAGVGHFGALTDNEQIHEEEMVTVNCLAPVALTRGLLPAMLERAKTERRRAGIIVVASTAAFFPLPRFTTYAASKAFDLHYALGLSAELAQQPVDVLALCPGPTRTDFFRRAGIRDIERPHIASAETVARRGLAALGRRPLEVVGASNRLAVAATRVTPRGLLLWAGRQWAQGRKERGA